MLLKRKYKVFFATPFDVATKSMYDMIIEELERDFSQNLEFSQGTGSDIEPSTEIYSKIEEFKAQNQDYLTRFQSVIQSSDIVVADLTNNNPSVHVELGIALTLKKNILRVSGRDLVNIATDLRGYEINKYQSRQELSKKINRYLTYFLSIKRRDPIQSFHDGDELGPNTTNRIVLEQAQYISKQIVQIMRDGEIKVNFEFKASFHEEEDWFSVLLRAETPSPWLGLGYFVFVRRNGELEVHRMLTIDKLDKKKYPSLGLNTEHILRVNIDGDHLIASLDEAIENGLHVVGLENQSPGMVVLGCYRSHVHFRDLEIANHDTIAF